jgi:putative tryptophan/tyrosine transport system substrate-binding protein
VASTVPKIFFLVSTTHHAWEPYTAAFEAQLKNDGWTKGKDYTIEYHPASGVQDLYHLIAKDFANRATPGRDVIVTGGTRPTIACASATSKIPIVYATAGSKLSLGANVTGISNEQTAHVKDRLDYIIAKLGQGHCVGSIGNTDASNVGSEMDEIQKQAQNYTGKLSFYRSNMKLQTVNDIHPVMLDLKKNKVDVLFVCTDPLITTNADLLNEWAVVEKLSTMHALKENWGTRGLMWWGPIFEDMFKTAADFVDKILRGTSPSSIAPQPAAKMDNGVNQLIAGILGLSLRDAR